MVKLRKSNGHQRRITFIGICTACAMFICISFACTNTFNNSEFEQDEQTASIPSNLPMRQTLDLPSTVKYVYINIGTSWDPWPGCGTKGTSAATKGHNNPGGLAYDEKVFCVYVEPLFRVNKALHERGQITNSSILIHAAVGEHHGLAPFNEYAGVAGVASSLAKVNEEVVAAEKAKGGKGPFVNGAVGQSWTTVITLKDLLDIIPDHVRILQLKTDMQGFDVTAIRSAGKDIRRVDEIYHECYGDNQRQEFTAVPVPNTYRAAKAQLEPYGFEGGNQQKHDCNWRRKGIERVPGMVYLGDF